MGDEEEGDVKKYVYEGARAEGELTSITAGEEPKVLTKELRLLGPRSGEGQATFPSGDVYTGDFKAGARHGHGKYVYAASPPAEEGEDPKPPVAEYEGSFLNGLKHGIGILTFADGVKYHGSFKAGKYEGSGTMFYANGDIYTGEWSAGKKSGVGTYFFKETGASIAGRWLKNTLIEGKMTDKFGSSYSGGFAASPTSAAYVPGGSFSLISGAAATLPVPGVPTWETQYGAFVQMTCKSAEAAEAAVALNTGAMVQQLKGDASNTRCEMFGSFAKSPTPPYGTRPVPGTNDPKRIGWMELFTDAAAYEAHKEGLKGSLKELLALGATGGAGDFEALEGPMYTLEKPGFGSGANHVIVICCQAKDAECAAKLVEVAKGEVAENVKHEPAFVRGTVIPPTAEHPLRVRWTVQWTSHAGMLAHTTYEHHKVAGPKIFSLVDMAAWGGGIEYDEAYHLAK